jgi:hypothetical protein
MLGAVGTGLKCWRDLRNVNVYVAYVKNNLIPVQNGGREWNRYGISDWNEGDI